MYITLGFPMDDETGRRIIDSISPPVFLPLKMRYRGFAAILREHTTSVHRAEDLSEVQRVFREEARLVKKQNLVFFQFDSVTFGTQELFKAKGTLSLPKGAAKDPAVPVVDVLLGKLPDGKPRLATTSSGVTWSPSHIAVYVRMEGSDEYVLWHRPIPLPG